MNITLPDKYKSFESTPHNFAPAAPGEKTVYGASRPGYPGIAVDEAVVADWIKFMTEKGISRVCCLLSRDEVKEYYKKNLIDQYRTAFGPDNVLHAPVGDFQRVNSGLLYYKILPFLDDTDKAGKKVVVHCSAGRGRTGQVLLSWLQEYRKMKHAEALKALINSGRDPLERLHQEFPQLRQWTPSPPIPPSKL